MRWPLALVAVVGVVGCTAPAPQPNVPPLVTHVDAGYDAAGLPCPPLSGNGCPAACCNERQHSCALGFPTRKGNTCETICAQAAEMGDNAWPVACLAKATSCGECQ